METAAQSGETSIAEELMTFFVEKNERECFAALLYTCYDLIKPDQALEVAWTHGLIDFVMPFMIQYLKDYTSKVHRYAKISLINPPLSQASCWQWLYKFQLWPNTILVILMVYLFLGMSRPGMPVRNSFPYIIWLDLQGCIILRCNQLTILQAEFEFYKKGHSLCLAPSTVYCEALALLHFPRITLQRSG